jgi:hypothetical protein
MANAARVGADSIVAQLTATAGTADLRGVYIVGLDAGGTIIATGGRSHEQAAGTSASIQIGLRSSDASRVVRVGVLLSDGAGNLSQIRTLPVGGVAALESSDTLALKQASFILRPMRS